jgi:hypothetical protein
LLRGFLQRTPKRGAQPPQDGESRTSKLPSLFSQASRLPTPHESRPRVSSLEHVSCLSRHEGANLLHVRYEVKRVFHQDDVRIAHPNVLGAQQVLSQCQAGLSETHSRRSFRRHPSMDSSFAIPSTAVGVSVRVAEFGGERIHARHDATAAKGIFTGVAPS